MTTRKIDAGKRIDFKKLKKLCRAAQVLVDSNADEIALRLMNGTMNGEALSTRLLFEMAEAGVDLEALGLGPVSTLPRRLAQEPQVAALPDEDDGGDLTEG